MHGVPVGPSNGPLVPVQVSLLQYSMSSGPFVPVQVGTVALSYLTSTGTHYARF